MNEQDFLLKVQAFVDGELSEVEQAEIASLAARDRDVHALVKELKQTRQALTDYEVPVQVPESREFYWSKIERQIETAPPAIAEIPRKSSITSILARWLVPATCLTGLLAMALWYNGKDRPAGDTVKWQAAYEGVNALTYRDYEEGVTVLWLSYPTDNTVAKSDKAATMN